MGNRMTSGEYHGSDIWFSVRDVQNTEQSGPDWGRELLPASKLLRQKKFRLLQLLISLAFLLKQQPAVVTL